MAEKRMVACDSCGAFHEFVKGFTGWGKVTCECSHKYGYNGNGQKLNCKCCKMPVYFTSTHDDTCPHCGKPLDGEPEPVRMVGCPGCTIPREWEKGKQLTCPHCSCCFDPETLLVIEKAITSNNAADIRMPAGMKPDRLICKHPLTRAPINSRVIAEPGYKAVLMQGSTMVGLVDGRSLLLSETSLKDDAADYDGASAPIVDVSVYYVRETIGQRIAWGDSVTLTDGYGVTTDYGVSGDIDIDQIIDPAAFMRTFGFDGDSVLRTRFGMTGGDGQPGDFALKVRECFRTILQRAMERVRDIHDYSCEDILNHQPEIRNEMLNLGNNALAEYGLSLANIRAEFRPGKPRESDILEVRTRGAFDWQLAREVNVHPWDDPEAEVGLRLKGTFRLDVLDLPTFRRCREANEWRNPARSEAEVRMDIASFVSARLQGRFLADIQQLLDTVKCPVTSLEGFAGSLQTKAEVQLNQEDGFFQSRGLRLRDITLSIEMGTKSEAYIARETVARAVRNANTDMQLDDIKTAQYSHAQQNIRTRSDVDTDTAVHAIDQKSRVEAAQHKADMERAQRAEEMERMRRQFGYDAWLEKQRVLREQEEADYERARRARMARQEEELSQVEQEERLFAVAQRIESSKLSWREKLDAYARLQRGVQFRDMMDEKQAATEAQLREERMRSQLAADDQRVMMELKHQEEMLDDELYQQRFSRELELRRQRAAEEAMLLKAEYERERAAAADEEKRAQAREEIETLRLMLEYLVKNGEHQVTAEALRHAQTQAQADWEREHRAEELKAAQARHEQQLKDERAMHDRAIKLVQEMSALRDEAHAKSAQPGQPAVDLTELQAAITQLNGVCASLKGGSAPAAPAANPMKEWFNGVVAQAPKAAAARPAVNVPNPAFNMGGSSLIVCGNCKRPFNRNDFMCPHCGWKQ